MKLWLTGATARKKVEGVRALRLLADLTDTPVPFASLKGAVRTWEDALEGSTVTLLLQTDDAEKMQKAVNMAEAGALDITTTPDNEFPPGTVLPDDEELPAADRPTADTPEDKVRQIVHDARDGELPSYNAAQVAAILMVTTNGVPLEALRLARSIGRVSPDEDFYEEVAAFLLDTFPPPDPQSLAQTLAQTNPGG